MSRIEAVLDQIATFPERNRLVWPAAMMVLGLGALAASLILQPGSHEWCYFLGHRFGGPCGFQSATGLPCPSCGMTRSWVWLARGHVIRAFTYNAAGAILFLGVEAMGVIGAVRLAFRDPDKWRIPSRFVSSTVIVWMVGPYLLVWIARMFGVNPLPPH